MHSKAALQAHARLSSAGSNIWVAVGLVQRKPEIVAETPAGITCYTLPLAAKGSALSVGSKDLITVSTVYTRAQVRTTGSRASTMCLIEQLERA